MNELNDVRDVRDYVNQDLKISEIYLRIRALVNPNVLRKAHTSESPNMTKNCSVGKKNGKSYYKYKLYYKNIVYPTNMPTHTPKKHDANTITKAS